MTRWYLAPVLCAALLTACASNSVKEEPPAPLPEFTPQAEVKELWKVSVGSLSGKFGAHLVPALVKDTLYVADVNGKVYALAADSGKTKWQVELKTVITGAIGADADTVVVGTRMGEVIALNAQTGERRWKEKVFVSSEVDAAPAVTADMIVVQSIDGRLTGFDAASGERKWMSDRIEPALSLRGTSRPVVANTYVFSGFANGKVSALQLSDGRVLWDREVAQPRGRNDVERLVDVDSTPVLWGTTLYAVAFQGKLMAIDVRTGRELWARDASSYVSMDVSDAATYVADSEGSVIAFGRDSGTNLWKQDKLHNRKLGGLAVHADAVVVGDFEGQLHWLARDDGHFIARYQIDSTPVHAGGIVDGDTLYVVSEGGRVAALQLMRK